MTETQVENLLHRLQHKQTPLILSPRPLGRLRPVAQNPASTRYDKPRGLWYACGDEWVRWLKSEMPDWLRDYKYAYVLARDTTSMCVIRTLRQFDEFEAAYQTPSGAIAWDRVAAHYLGIEICPYQWERRMTAGSEWYYPWDVASGCIWDPAAIREIAPIKL